MDIDEVRPRFGREHALLAELQHDSIARLIDGGATADGASYLVPEYVDERRWDEAADPSLNVVA